MYLRCFLIEVPNCFYLTHALKGLFTTKSTFYTSDFQCLGKRVVSRPSCQTAKPPTSSALPNRQTSVPFLPKSQALCQATTIPPPSCCHHLLAATFPHKSSLPTFSHTFTTKINLTHPKTNHLSSKQPQHVSLRHPFIHRTDSRCFSREIVSFPLLLVSGTSPTNHHEQHQFSVFIEQNKPSLLYCFIYVSSGFGDKSCDAL